MRRVRQQDRKNQLPANAIVEDMPADASVVAIIQALIPLGLRAVARPAAGRAGTRSVKDGTRVATPDTVIHFPTRRGDTISWDRVRVAELEAIRGLEAWLGSPVSVVAMDLTALAIAPGYDVHLAGGREFWVDAETGAPRGELDQLGATAAARRALGAAAHVSSVERVTSYDTYYYARHGREMHLPVWRVRFHDPDHSVVYLNTVTGLPVGFVDSEERKWRWARDALHDLDLPGLNGRRPVWDVLLLALMIGGTLIASTGVWLLTRRLVRIARLAKGAGL